MAHASPKTTPEAGNMMACARSTRISKPLPRRLRPNARREQASSWKLLDRELAPAVIDTNINDLDNFDESRAAIKKDLQPDMQHVPGSTAMSGPIALPRELQLSVAEYITMNEDRRNLCLTCKALQGLMTPFLYKDMVISTKKLSETFEATLTTGHPGIPHIRTIRVNTRTCTVDRSRSFRKTRVSRLYQLISAIPQDALTRFELPVSSDVDYTLDLLIRAKQRYVRNRQYHSLAWRDPPHVGPVVHEPALITCLQLYLQHPDDCDRAGVLIDLALNVKSLAIELDRRIRKHGLLSSAAEITRRLFTSANVDTPRAGLESLRITSFPLTFQEVLPSRFEMQNLKHLQLIECIWVGDFIEMLSRLGVSLVSYALISNLDRPDMRGPNEKLLSLMTAPVRLRMSSRDGDMLCGWPVLTDYAASLQNLYIADDYTIGDPGQIIHRGIVGFPAFCGAAASLEQLAMTCPSVEEQLWDAPGGSFSFLGCLTRVTTLKVLRLTIYPLCWQVKEGGSVSNELCMLASRHVMKTAVDQIFQTLVPTCPGLMEVIFNVRGDREPGDFGTPYEPPAFIRSRQVDAIGQTAYAGTPIKAHLIKRYEPCFDLLDPPTFIYD